LDKKIKKIGN